MHQQLAAAIQGSNRADDRIAIYHGPTPVEDREAIKQAFNTSPSRHPLRILLATDAAREGLNLQAHCWNLFHFDVPWNPSRMEQRNGRIDRKLQPEEQVFCHYFMYRQRPEDRILAALVRKTEMIKRELGSLAQVVDSRLSQLLTKSGIRREAIGELESEINAADIDAQHRQTVEEELEAARDRQDQRYGAWAQLLTQFRLIFEGGSHAGLKLPARKGYLFDPDRYAFLEGRAWKSERRPDEKLDVPRISDGVLFRVLSDLLILDGERLSYRTLDVEQIGSVYETMMGFELEVAKGRSIAVKPTKSHGAPTTINLEVLLAAKPGDRAKWLTERTDQKLTGQAAEAVKKATTVEELLAALERKIADNVTPNAVPKGAMIFQPSDERRRSGSHYTPRSLTEPIVRKTLEPILKNLGDKPTPRQLLDLKICDPAMGSAAFLVETCRQLGDVLVKAWHVHNQVPGIPPDEDELLHARRLIAQRCLYGVDKNPMAVDLGKLSLWLATLAKDHPFTFLDHALRHGDSLVGLTCKQITEFHWLPTPQRSFGQDVIEERIKAATGVRQEIIDAGDEVPFLLKQQKLALADESLNLVRFAGNLVIAAGGGRLLKQTFRGGRASGKGPGVATPSRRGRWRGKPNRAFWRSGRRLAVLV